jgi:hypothetical protein
MEIALGLSVTAVGLSLFALLISLGSAIRVHRLGRVDGDASARPAGLAVGEPVPVETLAEVTGNGYVSQLAVGPSLVIFVTQNCQPCRELIQDLNRPRTVPPGIQILIVEPRVADAESLRDWAAFHAHWAVDDAGVLKEAFKARGTPHTFLVQDGHVVAQALGTNLRSLLKVAAQTTSDRAP